MLRLRGGGDSTWEADAVVVEEPLRVHLRHRGRTVVLGSTMRTPGHDQELAVGLAVAEGVVTCRDEVSQVRPCSGDLRRSDSDVLLVLRDDVDVRLDGLERVSQPTSACGVCGRDRIGDLVASLGGRVPQLSPDARVTAEVLGVLPERMRARQDVFERTGGLHAAALATLTGDLLGVREDVGRHNAVDKVVGMSVLGNRRGDVLVVSGRVGFEIVQKAAMAGIATICAVSAPTSLAVEAARAADLTLVAFVRDGRATVFSGAHRVADQEPVHVVV